MRVGRRHTAHTALRPDSVVGLAPEHPASIEGRTVFPSTVVEPEESPRLLVSGANQRKLGDRVVKGAWKGMPIYALTLEERRTCPRACHHWRTCMGNAMPWARRNRAGPGLEVLLQMELRALQRRHPDGFVVRLHILGDFHSVEYVQAWAAWLDRYPALRVFGYTAWPAGTEIGAAVRALRDARWDRFAIRTSARYPTPGGATTLWRIEQEAPADGVIPCPAQLGWASCCGSCALCWAPAARDRCIGFVAHGMVRERAAA